MRTISISDTFAAAIAALTLSVPSTHAYVDIELDGGSHVKGESYSSSPESGKLVVYRPSGAIEIDRSKVRSIREVDGSLTEDAALSRPSAAMAPAAPVAPVSAAQASAAAQQTRDPKEHDRELSHQLMHMRLDRLAASQRGDQDTMKKLDKEIGSLQKERIDNYKKVDPSFDPESTKQ
jgi:ribosomal protein L12E/L44/L45/RPP1/RPP2